MARQPLILGTGSHYKYFLTVDPATGAPATLSGTPSLQWRLNGSATQGTAGLTLNVDFDSVTGLNQIVLDIDNGTLAASADDELDVEIAAGTAGGVSVVGTPVWGITVLADGLTTQEKADVTTACSASTPDVSGSAVASVTGNVGGNVTGTVAGVTPATTANILTTALTESYAADGAAPTLSQAIFAIQQFLQERSLSSTTLTVKKLDGSTGAMTFTLDDGTNPTSITRAS
jgi:hypothetical protein